MSIEKTILPDFVVAQIYASHLVIGHDVLNNDHKITNAEIAEPVSPKTIIPETPNPFSFLGNNGKLITIIVKEKNVLYINDNQLQFLSTILNACKLNLSDIALMNFQHHALGFDELREKTNPKVVIAFDVSPKEIKLPFTIPNYQVQDYHQCQFIFAPALSLMEGVSTEAKAEKTKLWMSLKKVFQL